MQRYTIIQQLRHACEKKFRTAIVISFKLSRKELGSTALFKLTPVFFDKILIVFSLNNQSQDKKFFKAKQANHQIYFFN
ncbi:MAG: hypothetical protein CSB55_04870 [Candidatus Cloacimonadota bacterium]|nr:MAG: hypothetical protein CSB55_04870 [Candidatus Cloacimonadota bacterium]